MSSYSTTRQRPRITSKKCFGPPRAIPAEYCVKRRSCSVVSGNIFRMEIWEIGEVTKQWLYQVFFWTRVPFTWSVGPLVQWCAHRSVVFVFCIASLLLPMRPTPTRFRQIKSCKVYTVNCLVWSSLSRCPLFTDH